MDGRRLRAAIRHRGANELIIGSVLGVFERDVEKAVLAQNAGIPELEFALAFRSPGVAPNEFLVRISRLRITISHPHVGMRWRVVFVEENLLPILAVVPLRAGEAEEPLLQKRVAPIPEGEGKTKPLLEIGEAADPVLAPAISAGARVLVREIIPGVAMSAVILPHRAPLPLAQVRAPEMPALLAMVILLKATLLGVHAAVDRSFLRMEIFREPGKVTLITIEDIARLLEPVKLFRIDDQRGRHA